MGIFWHYGTALPSDCDDGHTKLERRALLLKTVITYMCICMCVCILIMTEVTRGYTLAKTHPTLKVGNFHFM